MTTATLRHHREARARVRPADRRRIAPLLRLRIWLGREDLVERLAEGADAAGDATLELLAAQLVSPAHRSDLAAGLERLVAQAATPPSPSRAACPPNRHEVLVARGELELLAQRLRDPAPVSVRGAAMAERLICNAAGPLYHRAAAESGWRLARVARLALDGRDDGR